MNEAKLQQFYKEVANLCMDHDTDSHGTPMVYVLDLETALLKVSPEWYQEVING